jgi:predicted DNA-binding transcriptional regulator AlpA
MYDPELLNERQVWSCYGLSIPWQRRTRREGRGPRFLKLGRMVRYRRRDIEEYLSASTVEPKLSPVYAVGRESRTERGPV